MTEEELEEPDEEESADEAEADDEDLPEIEDDEFADIEDLADEVEEESGANADDEDDADSDGEDQQDASDDLPAPDEPDGETWGDLYVGTLTTTANVLIEEYGDESETIDEDLARQQHLDEYFNDWMESKGKREDMPPEQALVLSTAMFMVTVLGTKTDLASQLLSEVDL